MRVIYYLEVVFCILQHFFTSVDESLEQIRETWVEVTIKCDLCDSLGGDSRNLWTKAYRHTNKSSIPFEWRETFKQSQIRYSDGKLPSPHRCSEIIFFYVCD
jgi:hypothetical protein